MANKFLIATTVVIAFCGPKLYAISRQSSQLQFAISMCNVEMVRKMTLAGVDVNTKDDRGRPIVWWLASSPKCSDTAALATAKLLDAHGVHFFAEGTLVRPSLLERIATRNLPNTLAFLAHQERTGNLSQPLLDIARTGDLASIRVLLAAGANPLFGIALKSALFDAAASGHLDSVIAMLRFVKDKHSPKVPAAYNIALKNGDSKIIQAFHQAGVTPVTQVKKHQCRPRELNSQQSKLLSRLGLPNSRRLIGLAGAMNCQFIQSCGDLILIDCNSAADGPAYYINQKNSKLVSTCGGACMRGCAGCPPKEWNCECKF